MDHSQHQAGMGHGSTPAPAQHPPASSGPHSHGSGAHASMTMRMTFYFGYEDVQVLFAGLVVDSPAAMAAAFLVVFLVAMGYEGLKRIRERLLRKAQEGLRAQCSPFPRPDGTTESPRRQLLSAGHLLQTALHVLQVVVSYLLMLIAMTYNAYLGLAVVAGAGTGYWLFGWRRAEDADSRSRDMNMEKLQGSEGRGSCFTLDERVPPPSAPVFPSHKTLQ